ncbi:MAG TPA: 1,4-alpha-glucan branching protein GlgB [Chloroflexota bacterium]
MALTDFDLYVLGSGTWREAYEKLGAHPTQENGQEGVRFAVWAPNASAVSVLGDFNYWQHDANPLSPTGDSGVWQGFVPSIGIGSLYKYAIQPRDSNIWVEHADPYGSQFELRPHTASVVADIDGYEWHDADWLQQRAGRSLNVPISVYEVHLGSWKRDPSEPQRFLSYRELASQLPEYAVQMGYTHIELLPVAEHPLDMSWGYQTTGYFAPTSRFGAPKDFMYFVDCCHQRDIGVIIDWVPAHFPKDAFALARFDGTHLYEHADPRKGEHPDWGTLIFNYGRREVQTFLISNAISWLDRYHVDGLRVDAVASMLYLDYSREPGQWIPNQYGGRENLEAIDLLRAVNKVVHDSFPGALTIAEESTAWPKVTGSVEEGGLGFDLKWNMGWMHDTLEYFQLDPIHRKYHQNELTFSLMYAFTERFILPLSHDEVVHGKRSLVDKMPGDTWQKFANLRLLFAYMWGHPGKKLLFMGSDFGHWSEWNYAESLDWHLLEAGASRFHRGVHDLIHDLNELYDSRPALHIADFSWEGFEWIDFSDADNSVIAFRRRTPDERDTILFVCNMTPVVRYGYRIGLPRAGSYHEIVNTDAIRYGGSGVENWGTIDAEQVPWHGQPFSGTLTLSPLGAAILEPKAG